MGDFEPRAPEAPTDLATELVGQAGAALEALLQGFARAAERDGRDLLSETGGRDAEHLYRGLLTTLLRLVFLGLAEDGALLGTAGQADTSVLTIVELLQELQQQERECAESLACRFGAWPRLLSHFRAVFYGIESAGPNHAPRRGTLFDPQRFPFLESWEPAVPLPACKCKPATLGPPPRVDDETVLAVLGKLLLVDGQPVHHDALDEEQLGRVYEELLGYRIVPEAGRLTLRSVGERRHTGSHYTPRALCWAMVRRTLEPLLACMGHGPPSATLLMLKICDPAMGSGAFLMEACRFLGDELAAAWAREGNEAEIQSAHGDLVRHARAKVAQRCLYGVDKDESAVELAKLSLWLVAGADAEPFTFLDSQLRHGDSLVGLSLGQIRAFHWNPQAQRFIGQERLTDAVDAPEGYDRAKLIGDVLLGAFFAANRDSAREQERRRRLGLVERWLAGDGDAEAELRTHQAVVRARWTPFHWMLEFPEIFRVERPDPLDEGGALRAASMDAIIGNPPFLGGKRISTEHGDGFADWLRALHGSSKNTDLAAHFFRRADSLLGARGVIGFIATNTLSEGDTRRDGLRHLIAVSGHVVYEAIKSMPWPGEAAVHIAVVHTAKGAPALRPDLVRRLDGRPVAAIDSMLRPVPERAEAQSLKESSGICFIGCFLRGRGFVLGAEEAQRLGATAAPTPDEPLRPFLGGEEVNSSPTHDFHRFVIDFGDWPLERAAAFPELLRIVEQRVRPVRRELGAHGIDRSHKRRWWQFANPRPELRAALAPLRRCLVAARVTKHLCYAFQPTTRTFSDQLCVFALDRHAHFALLQSRVHEHWARLHSSTLGEGLRYTPSDCVETFPFPRPDPRAVVPALEAIGARLYADRAAHMVACHEGLTTTYNRLKDPGCRSQPIVALRRLHEELDRTVLDAYGWQDLAVPPFCPASPDERAAGEAFGQAVIDRLFLLNAERAAREAR